MAVRNPTIAFNGDKSVVTVTWTGLTKTTDDTGAPVDLVQYGDRSVHVSGTFGAGGSCRIQGSNNGTSFAVLTDPQGNDINVTVEKIEAVQELTGKIRPLVTAGDVTTSLTVAMVARRLDGLRT